MMEFQLVFSEKYKFRWAKGQAKSRKGHKFTKLKISKSNVLRLPNKFEIIAIPTMDIWGGFG